LVSDNYFDALGVAPVLGRAFGEPAHGGSSDLVAVISDRHWQTQYGGHASAVGSAIGYGNHTLTVIGVGPPGFHGLNIDVPTDVWVPFDSVIAANAFERTRGRWLQVVGRVRPGQARAPVDAEATAIMGRPVQFVPGASGFSALRDRLMRPLLFLEVVAGLVLLITCANLANLALAGAGARERELIVRRAMGASRGRLVRQLVTESALLSIGGAVLSIFVASWTSATLLGFLPPAQEAALINLRFVPDLRILGLVTLLASLTTVISGLAPAIRATRGGVPLVVRAGTGGEHRARDRASRALVVVAVTMCTLLLTVAGVFVRTLHNLRGQDAGYVENRLIVADVELPATYPDERRTPSFEALRERAAGLPGVEIAAFSYIGQLSGFGLEYYVRGPDTTQAQEPSKRGSFEQWVSPEFLKAMGTSLLAGRHFTDRDDGQSPTVAIVNEAFARTLFPDSNPVGRRFAREDPVRRTSEDITIVGVVRDSKWTATSRRSCTTCRSGSGANWSRFVSPFAAVARSRRSAASS
jgi:predicted permease